MKVLKGIAIAIVILAGILATAIKEMQEAELNQQLVSSLAELFKR